MGRSRSQENAELTGTNIAKRSRNGKDYFYYRMPDGSEQPLVHGDLRSSKEAAEKLNNMFVRLDVRLGWQETAVEAL